MRLPFFSSWRTTSQKMQRSRSRNHSLRGTQFVLDAARNKNRGSDLRMRVRIFFAGRAALILEHVTYLKRESFFRSAMRAAQTESTRSISSSLNCDMRLS